MTRNQILLALLVAVIWGSNFPIVKTALHDFTPLSFTTLRFAVSALALLPFARFPKKEFGSLLRLSILMGTGHFGLFFYGLSLDIEAAAASVLLQVGPPLTVLFGALVYREKVRPLQALGLMLSCIGVVTLIGLPERPPALYASFILLLAASLWALGNILMRELKQIPIFTLLFWLSFLSALQIAVLRIAVEGTAIPSASLSSYALVLYPALCSTIVAYGLWNYLLRHCPITQVAPFGLLTPVFGVFTSVLFLGDEFGLWHGVGAACILSGVVCSTIIPSWNMEQFRARIQRKATI